MKLNVLFSLTAILMALLGLAFLVVPAAMQYGALGANPSATLLAVVRAAASLFFLVAVLNWAARNSEPSTARNAIVLANAVGAGFAAILLALAVFSGADKTALIPIGIDVLYSIAFIMAGRASMSAKAG